jgi:Domain of unknown function (DUF4262)
MDDLGLQERFNEITAKIHSDVRRLGWSVIGVGSGNDFPTFTYSIGFWESVKHPEIIVTGLSYPLAHELIGMVFEQAQAGTRYLDGDQTDSLAVGYLTAFRRVHPAWQTELMKATCRYYAEQSFEALQLVYPDQQHRWPWQAEFFLSDIEPCLWLPKA